MIGIFGQTREDVATLLENVTINQKRNIGSMTIYNVTYNGQNLYIVVTGIGKANVAFAMGYALVKLCVNKVIVVGNATGIDATTAPIGSVAIATSSLEWDVDFEGLGFEEYVVPPNRVSQYPTDVVLQRSAIEASNDLGYQTVTGLFASGDTFVVDATEATQIATDTGAEFLDIDTAPVGQISYQMDIPYISVKGISNNANATIVSDYNTNRLVANNLSNRVVLEMLNTLFEEKENICSNQENNWQPTNTCINNINYYGMCNMYCNRNRWGYNGFRY